MFSNNRAKGDQAGRSIPPLGLERRASKKLSVQHGAYPGGMRDISRG